MGINLDLAVNESQVQYFVEQWFDDISEDDTPLESLNGYVNLHRDVWLTFKDKGLLVGVVKLKAYNRSTVDIHPFVGKEHRKYSGEIGRLTMQWFDRHAPEMYRSLITNIPSCKRYAILFARKLGFKQVGVYTDAFCKDGKHHDMLLFQRGRVYE